MASEIEYSCTGECMKKRIWKRWMVFVLALTMIAGTMALPMQEPVMAASKAYMKKMPVKWDLKKNKAITYQSKYKGIGMKSQKLKITNWKIEDAEQEGYKQLSFKATFTRKWKMTKSQVKKIASAKGAGTGGMCFCTVVDYQTGKSLECENDFDVTAVHSDWEISDMTYYRNKGLWVGLTNASVQFKVTYPAGYKNLCVGAGGSTSLVETKADKDLCEKKGALFGKTSYQSKKNKNIAHFIRVKG